MNIRFLSIPVMALAVFAVGVLFGQQSPAPAPPKLELAFELRAEVGQPIQVGEVAGGQRRLVPVNGGTFSGSGLKGKILPGGADHQLIQSDGFTQLEARYALETDAGEKI